MNNDLKYAFSLLLLWPMFACVLMFFGVWVLSDILAHLREVG